MGPAPGPGAVPASGGRGPVGPFTKMGPGGPGKRAGGPRPWVGPHKNPGGKGEETGPRLPVGAAKRDRGPGAWLVGKGVGAPQGKMGVWAGEAIKAGGRRSKRRERKGAEKKGGNPGVGKKRGGKAGGQNSLGEEGGGKGKSWAISGPMIGRVREKTGKMGGGKVGGIGVISPLSL